MERVDPSKFRVPRRTGPDFSDLSATRRYIQSEPLRMPRHDCQQLEQWMRRDPGQRGVVGYRHQGEHLAGGQLASAAQSLAAEARRVVIVTGFPIPTPDGLRPETDGPPGAALLARTLLGLNIPTSLVVEPFAADVLRAACRAAGIAADTVIVVPTEAQHSASACRQWAWDCFASGLQPTTHCVAIERVGPSHTPSSVGAGLASAEAEPLRAQFASLVSVEDYDRGHNMRGEIVDAALAPLHVLFDRAVAPWPWTTIGVGDGGNEIGMGQIAWDVLSQAIARGPAPRIACRVATDHLIIAGVSNWGAQALAAAVAMRRDREDLIASWSVADEQRLIDDLVTAGAVDGVTRQPTATVDNLPPAEYLAVWAAIRSE